MLHEKYILQLYSTVTLTFGKLFIICLHMSYLQLQLNSQKQFCTDNSVHLIVQLDPFYSILKKKHSSCDLNLLIRHALHIQTDVIF